MDWDNDLPYRNFIKIAKLSKSDHFSSFNEIEKIAKSTFPITAAAAVLETRSILDSPAVKIMQEFKNYNTIYYEPAVISQFYSTTFQKNHAWAHINDIVTSTIIPSSAVISYEDKFYFDKLVERNYLFGNLLDGLVEAIEEVPEKKDEEIIERPFLYLTESQQVRSIIESVMRDNQELYRMRSRDFEKMTAELLRNQGFETHLTKQTRDGGYDIYAILSMRGQKPLKFLVECKRYREDRPVGIDIVRSFKTVLNEQKANKGLIVTTSYFTDGVRAAEQETPYLLECKDRNDILDWVRDYQGIIIS